MTNQTVTIPGAASSCAQHEFSTHREADRGAFKEVKKMLLVGPWEILKLQIHFNLSIRVKLSDCLSFGDEGFFLRTYLFITRSSFVSDFNQFKKSIENHPIHDAIALANRILERSGVNEVFHYRSLDSIQADDDYSVRNVDFVDSMDRVIDRLLTYTAETDSVADRLYKQLELLESNLTERNLH